MEVNNRRAMCALLLWLIILPGATCEHLLHLDEDADVSAPGVDTGSSQPPAPSDSPSFDGMVKLNGGCFAMGDSYGDGQPHERPVHQVCLAPFAIDIYEVTNADYAACVASGGCNAPLDGSSQGRTSYYGHASFERYPLVRVTYSMAQTYCSWAKKRLPTEAEWEFAARGGLDGARYAWGDDFPNPNDLYSLANFDFGGGGDTSQVGSYPANGYGLYDMIGNVSEWTADWFSTEYYAKSPQDNPTGPGSGSQRVIRGGDWASSITQIRVSYRSGTAPEAGPYPNFGFRCAASL